MKKHSCLLLLLGIAACSVARAQVSAPSLHRWSFDLVAGPAVPVGQYASYIFDNRNVSPVKTGGLLEVSSTYHVNRSFGITGVANGQMNQIKDRPSDIVPGSQSNEPYVPLPYDNWSKILRLMAGGTYTLPLNKSHTFDGVARILGGFQKTRTAGFTQGFAGDPNDPTPYYAIALPWAFTYQGDIGFRWKPAGRLAVIVYAGYNGSLSRYPVTYPQQVQTMQYVLTLAPNPIPVEHKINLPTSSLLLRAGMAWDL